MKLFVEKLSKLIEVKKIIAISITITLIALAFMDKITSEQFLPIAMTIIAYYFGQSTAKSNNK